MQATEHLNLPIYELNDAANLADGYNNAMEKLDDYATINDAKFPITSANIEDGGINTVDLANGCVTENKLATASVTSTKIAPGAIRSESLSDNIVITGNSITDGTITLDKLSEDAFDSTATEGSNKLMSSNAIYEFVNSSIVEQTSEMQKYSAAINLTNNNPDTTFNNHLKAFINTSKTALIVDGCRSVSIENADWIPTGNGSYLYTVLGTISKTQINVPDNFTTDKAIARINITNAFSPSTANNPPIIYNYPANIILHNNNGDIEVCVSGLSTAILNAIQPDTAGIGIGSELKRYVMINVTTMPYSLTNGYIGF